MTRAGIGAATANLLAERVAIIGLGGTGSYILEDAC
jgi:tRNA A37 threonylcarbamoyladenosine dehydratase